MPRIYLVVHDIIYLNILAYPWFSDNDVEIVQWKYPFTPDQQIKYKIYKDLSERGYYITSADKFGGDFLVYPGTYTYFSYNILIIIIKLSILKVLSNNIYIILRVHSEKCYLVLRCYLIFICALRIE